MEFLNALKDTPIPALLLIGGFIFLFLGVATIKKPIVIDITPSSRKTAFVLGIILLGTSIYLFSRQNLEQVPLANTLTETPTFTEATSIVTSLEKETLNPITYTPKITDTQEITLTRIVITASTDYLNFLRKGPQTYASYVYVSADERPQGTFTVDVEGKYHDWFNVIAPDGQTGWLYKDWLDLSSVDISKIPISTNVPTPPATLTAEPPPTPTLCFDPKCFPTKTP